MLCTTTKYAFYMRKLDEILINLSYISICVHSRLDEGGATSGHKGRELVCERSHSSFQRVRTKILTLTLSLSLSDDLWRLEFQGAEGPARALSGALSVLGIGERLFCRANYVQHLVSHFACHGELRAYVWC